MISGEYSVSSGKHEDMTNRTERLANDLTHSREWNEKEIVRLGCIVQDKVMPLIQTEKNKQNSCVVSWQ